MAATNTGVTLQSMNRSVHFLGQETRPSHEGQPPRREKPLKANEDRIKGECFPFNARNQEMLLTSLTVCDGHDGGLAAQLVHENYNPNLCQQLERYGGDYVNASTDTFAVLEENLKPKNTTSGACVLNCIVAGRHLWCSNLGDCRGCFIPIESVPSGSNEPGQFTLGQLTWLSRDLKASDPGEIQRITAAGGRVVEGRVMGILEPSRTIGDFDVKERTKHAAAPIISITPEVRYMDMGQNKNTRDKVGLGFIVLATDGVWDFTTARDLCDAIKNHAGKIEPLVKRAVETLSMKEKQDANVAPPTTTISEEGVLDALSLDICTTSRLKGSMDDRTCLISLTAFPLQ